MRRYAIVTGDFVKTGGMDRANYALASYLARQDQNVTLIGFRADSDLLTGRNVELRRVPKPMNSYTLSSPILATSGLLHFAGHRNDDVKFLVNGGNCYVPATNWVHYVHAAFAPRTSMGRLQGTVARVRHVQNLANERLALRMARRLVANSKRTRDDVVNLVGVREDRVRVIYYGIDPERFRPADDEERASVRSELGWTDERPYVAFIGALGDRRKGFDVVFDAWRLLGKESSWDARLVVIGSGVELPLWKERAEREGIAKHIEFLGFRNDVPRVLSACDGFVAPTRYEAYGLAVHEALCCGLPAIVSADSGVAERYPLSLSSLLLSDPNSVSELASALRTWRGNMASLRTQVQHELATPLRERTWDHMARDIVDFMDEG